MSEMLARIRLVPESGYTKKTATKAALTRELEVELQSNGVGQHRWFTVVEKIRIK